MLALAALSQGIVWSLLLARLRRRRGARALRPDRAQGAVLRRWLPLQRRGARLARARGADRGEAAQRAQGGRGAAPRSRAWTYPTCRRRVVLDEWLRRHTPGDIAFAQLPFDHPVFILFTSGTTGKPKCIVHGAGGTLLQALKMYKLHFDLRPGDRFFYFCTTNWVVWNMLFAALAAEASVMLYDGSPFAKNGRILFDYAEKERITHFGTSAKFIDALAKRGLRPRDTHDLSPLRMILSTGSPLAPESFDYVYDAVKSDVCLASISGRHRHHGRVRRRQRGAAGVPRRAAVPLARHGGGGLRRGRATPSSARRASWCAPGRFLRCRSASGTTAAASATTPPTSRSYPNVWCHGDWSRAHRARHHAGLRPLGRDAQSGRRAHRHRGDLPRGGAHRRGRGSRWRSASSGRPTSRPTPAWCCSSSCAPATSSKPRSRSASASRSAATPRRATCRRASCRCSDIPRTKNGKVVELAVKAVVHGMPVPNTDALANPEALELFRDLPELAS